MDWIVFSHNPQIHCFSPDPQWTLFRDGAIKEAIIVKGGHKGKVPIPWDWFPCKTRKSHQRFLSAQAQRTKQEGDILKARKRALTQSWIFQHLHLGTSQPPEVWENKLLWFNSSVIVIWQLEKTDTPVHEIIQYVAFCDFLQFSCFQVSSMLCRIPVHHSCLRLSSIPFCGYILLISSSTDGHCFRLCKLWCYEYSWCANFCWNTCLHFHCYRVILHVCRPLENAEAWCPTYTLFFSCTYLWYLDIHMI